MKENIISNNELYQMDETLILGELINMDELNRWMCMDKSDHG